MAGTPNKTPGKNANRFGLMPPIPKHRRFGGKVFIESSDEDSSGDEGGGVKLNVSPYKNPEVVAAKAADDSELTSTCTPESTDSESLVTKNLASLTFQRGQPAGVNVFDTNTSSSAQQATGSSYADEINKKAASALRKPFIEGNNIRIPGVDRYPNDPRAVDSMIHGVDIVTKPDNHAALVRTNPTSTELVRQDESGVSTRHLVGDHDAQKVYSPTCCIFVANLPEPHDDAALEAAITRVFSQYGPVFVKIKRDMKNNVPFAFVQYTNDTDAQVALAEAAGASILGRSCRVEMCRANRTFLVFKRGKADISVEEALNLSAGHGTVVRCEPLDDGLAESFKLGSAVIVEFEDFDCDREFVAQYRRDRIYRVAAYEPGKAFKDPRDNADKSYLADYELDRRSVYMGSLPASITADDIKALYQGWTNVQEVRYFPRDMYRGNHKSFAFVVLDRPDMPEVAVKHLNGKRAFGTFLFVQRKTTKERAPRRVKSDFVRKLEDTPNNAGPADTPTENTTPPASRRVVTHAAATPFHAGSTPFRPAATQFRPTATPFRPGAAQATPAAVPAAATPSVVVSSAAPVVVSSTTATTPAGGLTVPGSGLSALTPPFGPNGFYQPSPHPYGGLPAFGAFGGFNGHQFPVERTYEGFFLDGMHYVRDPANGVLYPIGPAVVAPPVVDTTNAYGQRFVPSGQYVPAAEYMTRVSSTSSVLKEKKSVTFADPVEQASPNEKKTPV